jgi:hypothetical protein
LGDPTFAANCAPVRIARRTLLAAGPAVLATRAVAAESALFPDDFRILVAGPPGGALAQWAWLLVSAMHGADPDATLMQHVTVGGEDGVTAANQFAARIEPDGMTALLAPGAAALSRLSGDPRAQFDVGVWLAVTAGVSPGICASRVGIADAKPGTVLRVAASGPAGPEMAVLLAAELLGLKVEPVFGLARRDAAARALTSGAVDTVFVHGPDTVAHVARLAEVGAPAQFALGLPGEKSWQRDPQMPTLPALPELLAGRDVPRDLVAAWAATAMAAQLEFGLVLPALSPAPQVAQWRRAGDAAAQTLRTAVADVRVLSAAPAAKALAPSAQAMLDLRQWLASRFKWQPV